MPLTHQTDHAAALAARQVERLKDVVGWVRLCGVFLGPIQELENTLWTLSITRWLKGSGYQLDQLGELLAEPRNGLLDADYLQLLKAKIRVLRSSGGPLDILRVFKTLLPNNKIWFSILGGAAYILEIGAVDGKDGETGPVLSTFSRFAEEMTTDGVGWYIHYDGVTTGHVFSFDNGVTLGTAITAGDSVFVGRVDTKTIFSNGDLITVAWGLSVAENRVTDSAGNIVGTFANNHPTSTQVSRVAAAGQFVKLTGSAASGQPTINFTSIGKSYSPFTVFIIEPGTALEERLIVSSSSTTSITFSANLAHTHASGSFAYADPFTGLGSETGGTSDDSGGALSGILTWR